MHCAWPASASAEIKDLAPLGLRNRKGLLRGNQTGRLSAALFCTLDPNRGIRAIRPFLPLSPCPGDGKTGPCPGDPVQDPMGLGGKTGPCPGNGKTGPCPGDPVQDPTGLGGKTGWPTSAAARLAAGQVVSFVYQALACLATVPYNSSASQSQRITTTNVAGNCFHFSWRCEHATIRKTWGLLLGPGI